MAVWNNMSGAAKGGAGAAVTVAVALVGWWVAQSGGDGPDPQAEPAQVVASAPAAAETAPATATTEAAAPEAPAAETAAPAQAMAPTIDVLRVAPDGTTTLAGLAEPGAMLSVQIDGAEVASVQADGAGQFATLFTLAPSGAARMLSLVARLADGTDMPGAEAVAIAPFAAPQEVQVAVAETGAETAAETAETAETAELPEAPAAIILSEDGAQVAQAAEPVPADLAAQVSLDVISYTAEGAVQLGGKGSAGATLVLYLDNAQLAQTGVDADGAWSLTAPDIAAGIYTLRIDQTDAAGKVTSRLETPFKRETLEALAAASGATAAAVEPAAEPEPAQTAEVAEQAADTGAQTAETAEAATEPAPAEAAPEAEAPAVVAAEVVAEPAPEAATEPEPAAATETATETSAETATETTNATASQTEAAQPAAAPVSVTVQPGFTLWAIAKESFGSGVMYVQVFEANRDKIKDPDLIYPGQVLLVPTAP